MSNNHGSYCLFINCNSIFFLPLDGPVVPDELKIKGTFHTKFWVFVIGTKMLYEKYP